MKKKSLFTSLNGCNDSASFGQENMPNSTNRNVNDTKVRASSSQARLNTGCSFPFSGTSYSWTSTGSKLLATNQSTDKKYTWRTSSAPNVKFKITLNTNYPIIVRCVGVKGLVSETYELYDGCYDLTSNGSVKEFSFDPPTITNWLGNKEYVYKAFDFEVIVKNRTFAGKTNSSVPVTIKTCASTNGICVGY